MKSSLFLLILSLILPVQSWAGSRGLDIAFLDVTTGTRSKASLRLAELLEQDMRALFLDAKYAGLFPWSEDELKLENLTDKKTGLSFDRLLNTKDAKKISSALEKSKTQDGLIVFFHDAQNGFARLKLYDSEGKECLLLRLPLEGIKSAMPSSLLKQHRRGAIAAIGAAVRWSP